MKDKVIAEWFASLHEAVSDAERLEHQRKREQLRQQYRASQGRAQQGQGVPNNWREHMRENIWIGQQTSYPEDFLGVPITVRPEDDASHVIPVDAKETR